MKKKLNHRHSHFRHDQVYEASLKYFNGDELAATTWINKYALKDDNGNFAELTPAAMHARMAKEFARIEKFHQPPKKKKESSTRYSDYGKSREFLSEEKILNLLKDFRYIIPQGSVMAALGNPYMFGSLSNCVVIPEIYDSYGGIFFTDQQLAQLFKRRCGVGVDISTLRPSGMYVSNAAGSTTGAVSFMERFSNTTREVAQHGRRGALMITMDIAHPDIENFITIKQDLKKVTGANISVRISDEFMMAVTGEKKFTLRFPVNKNPLYKKEVSAREVWNSIVRCARNTAEPGIIFWDRQHKYSTSSVYPGYKNVSTNPCSEIAMQGGDSCRLISLNLYSFVDHPFTPQATFNQKIFYEITYEAQRLLDDLVDLELEAIERIINKIKADPEPDYIKDTELRTWQQLYDSGKRGRRTGLGFTALADTMAALGIKFDSENALTETEKIMRIKCRAEFDSSIDMAIERGKFKEYDADIDITSDFIKMMKKEFPEIYYRMKKYGRRNISISTVAPTGSLSILAQTTSGIEPVFMLSYLRRRKINPEDKTAKIDFVDALGDAWQEFIVYHPKLKAWMEVTGEDNLEKSPYHNATANEIDWKKRVEMQAIVQKYTTHSISSTINLPEHTTTEQVENIFLEAWRMGLKGVTVYREGSRAGVLIAAGKTASTMECTTCVVPER